MRQVTVFAAEPVQQDKPVEPVTITVSGVVPPMDDQGQARMFFNRQGAALAEAITSACPGATVDALLVALLQRAASRLRVPHRPVGDVR